MPQDNNPNNEHKENINAVNYNPNRPNQGESDNKTNQGVSTNSSTKKAVDTAAKGLANRVAPGVGGEIYDKAKKVPVVGNKIEDATSNIANAASKIPGVDTASKIADKTGVLDKLNGGASQPEETPTKPPVTNNKHNKGKLERREDNNSTGINRFRRNNDFNPLIMGEYQTEMAEEDESDVVDGENIEDGEFNDSNEPKSITINPDTINNDVEYEEEPKKGVIGTVTGVVKNVLNTRLLIMVGGIAFFVFLLFLVISGGAVDLDDNSAYVDTQCNYNETRVTVTNCYTSSSDKVEYETVDIKDYIIGATYAYTYNDSYSDDTLKALMITLKTNALSYGSYSSSSKNVSLKSCSSEINYCSITNGCNLKEENGVTTYEVAGGTEEGVTTDIPPISEDYKTKLESLYNDISGYLYISSSYDSTIKRLSSRNALEFNENTIDMFEELASSGSNYTSILNTMYNVEEETEEESEEEEKKEESNTSKEEATSSNTIFVGDSRGRSIHDSVEQIASDNTIFAGGKGYTWFAENGSSGTNTNASAGGIEEVNDKLSANSGKIYNIVIWLGVNDDSNVNKYFNKYVELASGQWSEHTIYIMEVGPVDERLCKTTTNAKVDVFNATMKEMIESSGLSNLIYLDIDFDALNLNMSVDGLHYYDIPDNINIYNAMLEVINNSESISSKLKLYNLDTYCHQYTVTENDLYWWPVGSAEETGNNIYGGTPTTTTVTSPFGIRYIRGKKSDHRGIDISGGNCYSNVVIAAKNGTVIATNDSCPTEGAYGSRCGGQWGNYVKIEHDDGTVTGYAHMSKGTISVKVGDKVVQGQKLGLMGNSGSSIGCHLHFEVRVAGTTSVDPLDGYVDPNNPRPVQVSSINVVGGEGKSAVCQTLLASGYSKNATAAIMTNIQAEGSFQTNNLENCYEIGQCCKGYYGYCKYGGIIGKYGSDEAYTAGVDSGAYPKSSFINDHAGYGMIQWTYWNRKEALYDYAKSQNKSIADIGVQLGFMMEEVKGYADTYKMLTGNYDASAMTLQFCREFENPAGSCSTRVNNHLTSMINYVNNGCQE